MRISLSLSAAAPLVFALLVAAPTAVYAQCPDGTRGDDTIVCDKDDRNGTDALAGDDTVRVESGVRVGGTVDLGPGADTAINKGYIEVRKKKANGLYNTGADSKLINKGRITTRGRDSAAIESDNSTNVTVTNSGTITTLGADSDGIDVDGGSNNRIHNQGVIITHGPDADGIESFGDNVLITNTGRIETSGDRGDIDGADGGSIPGASGIEAVGDSTAIVNRGAIETHGRNADGIIIEGANARVLNAKTGSITVATDLGSTCINAAKATAVTVTNNGTINCAGGKAVVTGAANDVVNLGSSSRTEGDIELRGGDDALGATGSAEIIGDLDGGPDFDTIVLDGGRGETGIVKGDITRFEVLRKNGAGTWILEGDAAVGQANLNAGKLVLDGGTLTGDVRIDDRAELEVAHARVSGDVVNNGVLDSNAGTFHIAGDYIQGPAGALHVGVGNPHGPGSDLYVEGQASLDGRIDVEYLGTPKALSFGNTTFPLVTAEDGRNGKFDKATIDSEVRGRMFGSLYTADVIYTSDQALLRINRASQFARNLAGELNRVQEATAEAFDNATATGDVSNELAEIIETIHGLDQAARLRALQTAGLGTHGEMARVSRFLTRQVMATLALRHRRLCHAPQRQTDTGELPHCTETGLWGSVFGQHLDQEPGGEGFLGFDADTHGFAIGNDWVAGNGYLGFSAGLAQADVELNRSGGHGDISSYWFAGYGGIQTAVWYANASLVYARHEYEQARNIFIGDTRRTAKSEHDAEEWAASVEAGYHWLQGKVWTLTPFVGVQYSLLDEEGFTEEGAGALNQHVEPRETASLRSDLGLRLLGNHALGNGNVVTVWASAAWSHNFTIDDRTVAATFAGAPNTRFTLDGRDIDENGVKTELGLAFGDAGSFQISLSATGEFRGDLTRYGAELQITALFQ